MLDLAQAMLQELVAIRKALQGLRRDLKRRDDRDRSEHQQPDLVVLSSPPIRLNSNRGQ